MSAVYRYTLRCDGCGWVTRGEVWSPTALSWEDPEADVQRQERCPNCGPFASVRIARPIPPNPTIDARQLAKPRTPLRGIPMHHTPRRRH